ncbi:hypothetical protein BHE74_00050238 [Ensete ventricosum]|nr:hypothetical protein GW17_00008306 [Ensete ventricosum]RWW44038.1 hypothetical protein BHE74_00050238 [Ensete ventricosum]
MNKGLCQNSVAQQMMRGSSGCRSLNSIRPPPEQTFPLLPSSSSPSVYAQFPQPSAMLPITPLHDGQELPESWSQLLPGGCWGEEEKYGLTPLQTRKIETWEDQLLYPAAAAHVADVKREYSGSSYLHGHGNEEEAKASKAPWSQIMAASSPRSCITSSFSRSMLDFSNKPPGRLHHQPDNSSVVRSTCLIPCSCSIL